MESLVQKRGMGCQWQKQDSPYFLQADGKTTDLASSGHQDGTGGAAEEAQDVAVNSILFGPQLDCSQRGLEYPGNIWTYETFLEKGEGRRH